MPARRGRRCFVLAVAILVTVTTLMIAAPARATDPSWSALTGPTSTGMNGTVYALTTDSAGNLYAGGVFTTAGGTTANNVAKWNGTTWSSLGTGQLVRVVDAQRFTVVPFSPALTITYYANVAATDSCVPTGIDRATSNGRIRSATVARTDLAQASFASQPGCTPPGHTLAGWNTTGTGSGLQYGISQKLPTSWETDTANTHTLYAVWRATATP